MKVGDRSFTYAYIEQRALSDLAQGRINLNDVARSIANTVSRIQREEIIRAMGRERGISVSDQEVDDEIKEQLGLDPALSHDEMAAALRIELLNIKLPLDDYLEIIESQVIENKIRDELVGSLEEEAEQVNLLLIQAGSQANAIKAMQELEDGGDFGEVAAQYSRDPSSQDGGAFGWAPRELLDSELADVAFSITGRSGIVETEEDFYIIDVLDRQTRPIGEEVRQEVATRKFDELLETAFDETEVLYNLTESQLIRLNDALRGASSG